MIAKAINTQPCDEQQTNNKRAREKIAQHGRATSSTRKTPMKTTKDEEKKKERSKRESQSSSLCIMIIIHLEQVLTTTYQIMNESGVLYKQSRDMLLV